MKKLLIILAAVFLLAACNSNTSPDPVNEPGSTEAGGAPIINAVPALKPDGTPYDVNEKVVNEDGEQAADGSAEPNGLE